MFPEELYDILPNIFQFLSSVDLITNISYVCRDFQQRCYLRDSNKNELFVKWELTHQIIQPNAIFVCKS